MSLLPPYTTRTWKIIGACVAGIALLGVVLWGIDAFGNWRFDRGVAKDKAEIKQGLANIASKESTIANLQTEVAVEKERVRQQTVEHLENINATEQVKAETNAALANLDAAKNANTTNSSVSDLEKALEKLQ